MLCSQICGHFVLGQTFWNIRSEGATETAERVSLQRAGVSKWWRELWETFISQIHFIDSGPVRAELTVVGGLEENEWLLAHMLTLKEPAALTLPPRLWNSLWWLFYQRSCPSPGKLRTGEDDPHFLKAKCSVLISRNELLVTQVNLLHPGRFIVFCRSWPLPFCLVTRRPPHVDAHARRSICNGLICTAHSSSAESKAGGTEFQIMTKWRRGLSKSDLKNITKKKGKKKCRCIIIISLLVSGNLTCNLPLHPSRNWKEFNIWTTIGKIKSMSNS